jgi:N-acetylneuraminic acid mutarotase
VDPAYARSLILALALATVACGDDGGSTSSAAPPVAPSPSSPSWQSRRSLPAPQQETAVVELGGKVYVLGGLSADNRSLVDVNVYDPATDSWSAARPLPEPAHHINAAVTGGRIWVTGVLGGSSFTAAGVVWSFDPTANEWTTKTAMPAGTERGASAVAAVGDHVYIAGGLRDGSVADFSRYDTKTDAWESLPPLPSARDHGGGAAFGARFYAFAGRNGGLSSRVDVFDPATSTWSSRAPLPTARAGFAIAVREGRAYLFGGEGNGADPNGMFGEVEAYDFAADTWTKLAPMKTPRHGMGAATIGAQILVPGGGTKAALAATDIVEALTF